MAKPRARTPAAKQAQAQTVAAGIVAGKTQQQIADELGLSRQWVSKLTQTSETEQVLARMVQERLPVLGELFDLGLEAIRNAYRAKARNKDGHVVGRDHYARLAAVQRLTQILTAGRPMPKPAEKTTEQAKVTLPDLLRLLQEHQRPQ